MRNRTVIKLVGIGLLLASCNILKIPRIYSLPDHFLVPNNSFTLIWNRNDIFTMRNKKSPMIINSPGMILVEGYMDNNFFPEIYALESATGDLKWKISGMGEGDEIVTEGNTLYRATIGSAQLKAYDLENRKLLWSKLLFGGHSAMDLYSYNKKIYVNTNNDLFFILSSSGEILNTIHSTSRIFMEKDDRLYLQNGLFIKAIHRPSKSELWNLEIDNVIFHAPIFEDESIFVDTEIFSRSVFSIDQSTGHIKWQIPENTLSNLLIMGETLYFINTEGYFVGVDKNSGHELIKLSFSPGFELRRNIGEYYLAGDVTEGVIVISFGDNHQIMALKMENP